MMDEDRVSSISSSEELRGFSGNSSRVNQKKSEYVIARARTKETASPSSSHGGFFTPNKDEGLKNESSALAASLFLSSKVARNPYLVFGLSLVTSLGLSIAGYYISDFSVSAELDGWLSRGTFIANQNTQTTLVNRRTSDLFFGGSDVWLDLTHQVQSDLTSIDPTKRRRSLSENSTVNVGDFYKWFDLPGCDVSYYSKGTFLTDDDNLSPIWRTNDESISVLDAPVLLDICTAERNTQTVLQTAGLCGGCDDGGCLPPISVVSFARLLVGDRTMALDCKELISLWSVSQPFVETRLLEVVNTLRTNSKQSAQLLDFSDPHSALALLVDSGYARDGNEKVRYTSSILATSYSGRPVQEVFEMRGQFDRAESSEYVRGSYDTLDGDFNKLVVNSLLVSDMRLVIVSLFVTTVAILVHTRSLWLTFVGLTQIVLSFPLAYFFYNAVLGLSFFPFLNFIGFFVVFAIGADDIFVAVDNWKNARLDHPDASVVEVAVVALPSAARSMLLTTVRTLVYAICSILATNTAQITTSIAFLATAICPVPALQLFAIFSGLLIVFDYMLCLLLVFPALCIYDRWSCCQCFRRARPDRVSYVRHFFSLYSNWLYRLRYLWLVLVIMATLGCSYIASKLRLPATSEVRLLRPTHEFERNYVWRSRLLAKELERERGSRIWFMWGVVPADTGNHKNPIESSTMVLDEKFDPSPVVNQMYLRYFCNDLLSQSFASEDTSGVLCPLNAFEGWLEAQAAAAIQHDLYKLHCHNATELPLKPEHFHQCMIGFAQAEEYKRILFDEGRVKIIRLPFRQRGVMWDAGQDRLKTSWIQIQTFTESRNAEAPPGVNNVYGTSHVFWWYDTNDSILSTAMSTIVVALTAGFVALFLSTLSFAVTLFAVFSIAFVLLSSTATLVSLGWTLGFLESICFAILVGVSSDFVLHFGHAYCALPGVVSREKRTEYALNTMGPSILGAAITTIAASISMLFTSINFFQLFGNILLWSLVMGLVGSMFVFLVLVVTFGPSNPGLEWIKSSKLNEQTIESARGSEHPVEFIAESRGQCDDTDSRDEWVNFEEEWPNIQDDEHWFSSSSLSIFY